MVQSAEEDPKELSEVHVVRSLLKSKTTTVIQVHCKLGWESLHIMHMLLASAIMKHLR